MLLNSPVSARYVPCRATHCTLFNRTRFWNIPWRLSCRPRDQDTAYHVHIAYTVKIAQSALLITAVTWHHFVIHPVTLLALSSSLIGSPRSRAALAASWLAGRVNCIEPEFPWAGEDLSLLIGRWLIIPWHYSTRHTQLYKTITQQEKEWEGDHVTYLS